MMNLTSLLLICAATTFAAGLVVTQRRLVANVARRFVRLPRFEQTLLVVAVCVMTVCAQKSGTNEVSGAAGDIFNAEIGETQRLGEEDNVLIQGGSGVPPLQQEESNILNRSGETPLPLSTTTSAPPQASNLRVENSQAETNVFAITSFSLDRASCAVSFTAAWTSNFFDSVDSRNVELFSSTNLLARRWTALGACAMPSETNACAFVVTSNDVSAAARLQFRDTFAGLGFFRFGLDIDSDGDGLTDTCESLVALTDPMQPDTDNDGMNDGWESRHWASGFDPLTDNATDDDLDNDASSDLDGDGVANGEECAQGLDPASADTDGDGVSDGVEIAQGSDPNDASDEGETGSRVPLSFVFGDPSDSHSEKYRLAITPKEGAGRRPASFSWLNEHYGECEIKTAYLKPGWRYEARFYHAGTNGKGVCVPDYDYVLGCPDALTNALPRNVVIDDPDSLFGADASSDSFAAEGKVATITVYAVTGVTICDPDDASWKELDAGRVVLDDEMFRIKVEVAPRVASPAQCRQMFGDSVTVKTSGTCPGGAAVALPDDAAFVSLSDRSEIRFAKTFTQLKTLEILPANSDGVNEMSAYDVGSRTGDDGSDLSDSRAFLRLGFEQRGFATGDPDLTLSSTPPCSKISESFFKAAGCEIVTAAYGRRVSDLRQIMNQADYFYYSGHGFHQLGLADRVEPSIVAQYWDRDLDCVVISACSILDINDYNNNYWYDPQSHAASPGKLWEAAGPHVLLGYNYVAPSDSSNRPSKVMEEWLSIRGRVGDVKAWMNVNALWGSPNACAIEKGVRYVYFKKSRNGWFVKERSVPKEEW